MHTVLQEGAESVLATINQMLVSIERAPRMWGQPEAVELQFLLLVDLRQELLRPTHIKLNPHETRKAYVKFVGSLNGESTNHMLHAILHGAGHVDELPRLLGDFGRWMAQEYPPEV